MGQQDYTKHVVMDLHWCMVTVNSMGRANCTGSVNCKWRGRGRCTRRELHEEREPHGVEEVQDSGGRIE
jgi:hypothetical protein